MFFSNKQVNKYLFRRVIYDTLVVSNLLRNGLLTLAVRTTVNNQTSVVFLGCFWPKIPQWITKKATEKATVITINNQKNDRVNFERPSTTENNQKSDRTLIARPQRLRKQIQSRYIIDIERTTIRWYNMSWNWPFRIGWNVILIIAIRKIVNSREWHFGFYVCRTKTSWYVGY